MGFGMQALIFMVLYLFNYNISKSPIQLLMESIIKIYFKMIDAQFENFIINKQYKISSQFNSNPTSLLKLINYVSNLPVQKKSFDVIFDLIKFYRTPIFITCQSLYDRMMKSSLVNTEMQTQIQQIATYVKNYIQQYKLQELEFFYKKGFSKKKKKMPEKSQEEKQFLKYIQTLGKHLNKIKKQINQIGPDKLKLELDSILAAGLQRKLNTLQLNYEQYFKKEADKIYNDNRKKIQQDCQKGQTNKGLEPKPQYQHEKKVHLCCRTYFYDGQVIRQPENLVIEYKNYFFPLGQTQIRILKKTICGFLNTDGGTIFLGIHQNVDTKKRKVMGIQLNQYQKQNLLFSFRKDVVKCIEPDIISNKMYWVNFVPIKQRNPPNHFISGRYLVKITVKFGQRNQIYSYNHDKKDYFAFRTQNQVIHREGRQILNAYRQRLKNPLPIPAPIHEGSCALPEEGCPINNYRPKRQDYSNNYISSEDREKKKYKEKEAADFIVTQIDQQQCIKFLNNQKLDKDLIVTSDSKKKICFIKVYIPELLNRTIEALTKLQFKTKSQFFQTQRGIKVNQQIDLDRICQLLQNYYPKINEKQNTLEFRSTQQSINAFLILRQKKISVNFIAC